MSDEIEYEDLPDDVKKAIGPDSEVTRGESNINYDGKQYLARIPTEIARAIGTEKGDKIKFKVIKELEGKERTEKIIIEYVKKND